MQLRSASEESAHCVPGQRHGAPEQGRERRPGQGLPEQRRGRRPAIRAEDVRGLHAPSVCQRGKQRTFAHFSTQVPIGVVRELQTGGLGSSQYCSIGREPRPATSATDTTVLRMMPSRRCIGDARNG